MAFRHFILFFFILLIICILDYFYLGRPAIGIDDANISMNYAWHLSQGEGFVFNHGGERVEGFTSLLWVFIIRCFYAVSSHPEKLMMVFLLILTTFTVTLVFNELTREVSLRFPSFNRKKFLVVFCIFLVSVAPPYLVWSVLSLMENSLWNFIFTLIVVLLLRYARAELNISGKLILVASGILLLLTRPEAMAWGVLFTVMLWITSRRNKSGLAFPAVFFTIMTITAAALTIFRERYFGYPFPNTYYAKVSADEYYNIREGALYLFRFIVFYHPLVTFLICVMVLYALKNVQLHEKPVRKTLRFFNIDTLSWSLVLVTIIIAGILVLPITTGGDHFGGFRFYQSALLFLAWGLPLILFFTGEQEQVTGYNLKLAGEALAITFLLFTAGSVYRLKNLPETRLDFEFKIASSGRKDAMKLNEFWKNNRPSVGIITVGGFSLEYAGETVDLMGLNNTLMGHSPGDRRGIKNHAAFNKDVFYRLQPDILLPDIISDESEARQHYEELVDENSFENKALKNILTDSLFTSTYHPVLLQKNNSKVFAFVSNKFESRMASDSIGLTKLRL